MRVRVVIGCGLPAAQFPYPPLPGCDICGSAA